jgi:hypothetical protein
VFLTYKGDLNGPRDIPADSYSIEGTQELSFHFFEDPGFEKGNDPVKSNIILIDQYGQEHQIKDVVFAYRG